MEILNKTYQYRCNLEDEMQEQVDNFLKQQKYVKWDGYSRINLNKIILREFRVPEIGRISDHVMLIGNNRVINVECKLDNIGGVIKQAEDHLQWCDYSVICLSVDSNYIANSYKIKIIEKGIGLWYLVKDIGVFEFILPAFNRKKNLELRKKIIDRILRNHGFFVPAERPQEINIQRK